MHLHLFSSSLYALKDNECISRKRVTLHKPIYIPILDECFKLNLGTDFLSTFYVSHLLNCKLCEEVFLFHQ